MLRKKASEHSLLVTLQLLLAQKWAIQIIPLSEIVIIETGHQAWSFTPSRGNITKSKDLDTEATII